MNGTESLEIKLHVHGLLEYDEDGLAKKMQKRHTIIIK
jgi:hypothetical protein